MEINRACKYCQSEDVIKFGTYKGVQRYFCKACRRKFKGDNSLFHSQVSPEHISTALSMYYTGSSINDIRQHLKQEHDYLPSQSVVFYWINKYTDKAVKVLDGYTPKVGDVWIADETMIDLDGQKVWLWDIIDAKTRFLLATTLSHTRTIGNAQTLMELALKRAGKAPKQILTDKLHAYIDGIELVFGGDTEHIQTKPFVKENGTNMIERWHSTLKERTKVMRALKDANSALAFIDGFLVYYNYFRPHMSLDGKTPAEEAGIDYPAKNWRELSKLPEPSSKPKMVEVGRIDTAGKRFPKHHKRPPKEPKLRTKEIKITPTITMIKVVK